MRLASLALVWQCVAAAPAFGTAETSGVSHEAGGDFARAKAELYRAVADD
jgi:hypothetical protein